MKTYHKIQTLYKRNPETKYKTLLHGQYSLPEFEYLQNTDWAFTEKVDGTNIRVIWDSPCVSFKGRSDRAQIPHTLQESLSKMFTPETMEGLGTMCLYGEGYGAKIQKGGGDYIRDGNSFILFDILAESGVWLRREDVNGIAQSLGIRSVPIIHTGTLQDAVDMCMNGYDSELKDTQPEGLVIRPKVELLNRQGGRVITKLKLKDFR